MKAMILAAGLGTRLSPYTDVLAKPAIPFLNIPLLYFSLALLRASRNFTLEECIINAHYKAEQIRDLAQALSQKLVRTQVTLEKAKPLGSGGGVWFAREHFKNETDFIVTNGDEVILPTHLDLMDKMLEQHRQSQALVTLLVKRDARVGTQFGGVWATPKRSVFGFGKTSPEVTLEGFHYVGVLLMNSKGLKYFPEGESNILYDAVMNAQRAGEKIEVFIDDCRWYETGNIKDYLQATHEALLALQKNPKDLFINELLKQFAAHSSLQKPNAKSDPKTLLFAEQSAQIHTGAKLSGFVVLGQNVVVPDGCELQNLVVHQEVKLQSKNYKNDLILK